MFEKLLEPITISKMEVKNRFVMAPISNLFATTNGEVTQRTLDYYAARGWTKNGLPKKKKLIHLKIDDVPKGGWL